MSNVARLEPHIDRESPIPERMTDSIRLQQASLLSLLADVLSERTSDRALDALTSALQEHFDCQRVAIAMVNKNKLSLQSISQQAVVDPFNSESRLIIDALQEACDHESVIRWPDVEVHKDTELGIFAAHRTLAGLRLSMAYCSVPLFHEQQFIGAILLERRDGFVFSEEDAQYLEKTSAILAPLLWLHNQADRGIIGVSKARIGKIFSGQFGTEHPGRRLIWATMGLLLCVSFFLPVNQVVSATAELVPLERRLVTAPRAGFIQSLQVVAGDKVKAGQLLASMDIRDLELEASRSASEIATAEVEFRAAMASFDRQASTVARSNLAQVRAQQSLVQRQLELSQLRAPIDGLVLMANSTSTLGAPLSRGDTLFEIAPEDDFEVHLLVDESDIREVQLGQLGELSLRARPETIHEVTVQSVHPIAEAVGGASQFRVTAILPADLEEGLTNLRPGESGQARLVNGKISLFNRLFGPLWSQITALKWRLLG